MGKWVQNGLTAGSINSAGEVNPGGCTTQDVIGSAIRKLLADDSLITSLFEGKIYRFDAMPDIQFFEPPFVSISPQSLAQALRPTNVALETVQTAIQIWHWAHEIDPLDDYEPGVTGAMAKIEGVLATCPNLNIDTDDGSTNVQLTTRMDVVDRLNQLLPTGGDQLVIIRELLVEHTIRANARTRLILNLERLGYTG